MIIGQDTTAIVEELKRYTGLFDEGLQRFIAGAETHAASADEKRLLRAVDEIGRLSQGIITRMDREFPSGAGRVGGTPFRDSGIENIGREFQKDGAGPALFGMAEGHGKVLGDTVGIEAGAIPLHDRFDHVHLVHFLEGALHVIPKR